MTLKAHGQIGVFYGHKIIPIGDFQGPKGLQIMLNNVSFIDYLTLHGQFKVILELIKKY